MSREITVFPTYLKRRRPVCDLDFYTMSILMHLWTDGDLSYAGHARLNLVAFAKSLNTDDKDLKLAVKKLCKFKLIMFDWATSEIFICKYWFRAHSFKTFIQKKNLHSALGKVASCKLKEETLKQAKDHLPKNTENEEGGMFR